MDIFNELKTKNNNYSDKINTNKYTQTFSLLKDTYCTKVCRIT